MNPHPSDDALEVLVIGGGQAGLATSWHLARHRVRHLVVDAAPELGHAWRSRWDSLRLFSPAEFDALPGMPFPAPPGSYPRKDEVADYLAGYAARFNLPVLLGCRVVRMVRTGDVFEAHTSQGSLRARQVVVATGPFQRPVVPALAAGLPPAVVQMHSADYRNPAQLPTGPVVVVGAANSGMQIAAELAVGRPVTLAVGSRPPRVPQRIAGRDLFWWLSRSGLIRVPAGSLLARRVRSRGDLVVGGSLGRLRAAGVTLRPRVVAASPSGLEFADGCLAAATAVVWATGFAADHDWLELPEAVVDGRVRHRGGVSDVAGLYFVGLEWQRTRGSALLGFVGDDAGRIADLAAGARRVR